MVNSIEGRKSAESVEKTIEERMADFKIIKSNLYNLFGIEVMDIIVEFSDKFKEEYPEDFSDYIAYHILIGSTPPPDVLKKSKFDTDDKEVENFVRDKIKEGPLEKEKKE